MRQLTPPELEAIRRLLHEIASPSERQQALEDVQHCLVEPRANDEVLRFHIEGYESPPGGQDTYRGADRFPVEGTLFDEDGVRIEVLLLHDRNHRMFEFELIKVDGTPVTRPNWARFQPTRLPER